MSQLSAYLEGKEGEMLAFLEQIVDMDSGSLDKTGVDRVGSLLAGRLESLGFAVERVPQPEYGDHLVAHKGGSGQGRILFLGHMDTVFPAGTAASRPFRTEEGRAYGPGVLDMKAGLAVLIYALEALRATEPSTYEAIDMAAVFNSDEELLSPTSRPIIEAEARQAGAVCVFEPARPGGEYVIARKGVGKYRLTVHGRAAHAGSQPEKGRSAIGEMAHKIVALHALTDLAIGTTVNVGVIHGGERSNVVAETAYAEIDLRVPDEAEARRADARIREIAASSTVPDTTAELIGGISFPPMVPTPRSQRLFEALRSVGRQLGLDLRGIGTGGGSDGNYASQFAPTL
ncbi:MAG: M20 family metallopeptidase, partial [Chloroflexota bacterium]